MVLLFLLLASTMYGASETINLVSKGGKRFPVHREYLQNKIISGLTHTSLENDPNAPEIPITFANGPTLEIIANLMNKMGEFKINTPWDDLTPYSAPQKLDQCI